MRQVVVRPSVAGDFAGMLDIFNHYVVHGFSTYTETPVDRHRFMELMAFGSGYPSLVAAIGDDDDPVGYGLLRPFSAIPAFAGTAEQSCFIHPEYTGHGIGRLIVGELERRASAMGIQSIIATVSTLNPGSVAFHRSCGFTDCGLLPGIGTKNGSVFGVVYLLKQLHHNL